MVARGGPKFHIRGAKVFFGFPHSFSVSHPKIKIPQDRKCRASAVNRLRVIRNPVFNLLFQGIVRL
jgi:hypothetical protein|tara:strand:- start:1400 stop:1597 length:198 start_codon:yes stop_codon:yes gene_type:complete